MSNLRWLVLLAVVVGETLGSVPGWAQAGAPRRYLVYFKDKANSPYSVGAPERFLSARALSRRRRQGIAVQARDLPVTPVYVTQLRALGGRPQVLYTSRWLNGAVISCDSATYAQALQLPTVRAGRALSYQLPAPPSAAGAVLPAPAASDNTTGRAYYGKAYAQDSLLGIPAAHRAGFRGEGMQIAVFDAGFPGADRLAGLQRLQTQGRVASTRNFVDGGRSVYVRNSHGTSTLSLIGGELPGSFVGTAPRATFHLCLTEDAGSENPIEEANWLAAAEYADSVGVDVISSSLGYTTFDRPEFSHAYADLNGRTAIGSLAALGAARAGMVVVNSAGNDGGSGWRYIGVPADADSIITVGAVDSLRQHAYFSSYGPTADGRLKPTLSAMGVASAVLVPNGAVVRGNGTSYACPELAGLVAVFWQANPGLTAQQVIAALTRVGSQASAPDNILGYGIPDFTRAYNLTRPGVPLGTEPVLSIFPNPSRGGELLLALPRTLQGQALRVRVLDARGALVAEQQIAAADALLTVTLQVRGRGLAPGTYQCVVRPASGASQTVRFVQQ